MDNSAIQIRQSYAGIESYPTLRTNFGLHVLNFGTNNDIPQMIIDLSGRSPINSSIINNKVTYICGSGIKAKDEKVGKYVPNLFESWAEVIEKMARDYVTLGAFALQVVMNKDRQTYSIYHQDVSRVRVSEYNHDTGEVYEYAICRDWRKGYIFPPVKIKAWGSETPEYGTPYLFYYCQYSPGFDFYGIPDWWSALNYVEADGNLAVFYNSLIKNNFNPSTIIKFSGNYEESTKTAIMQEIAEFSNPESTGNVLSLWLDGGESPEVDKLDASNMAQQYDSVSENIFQHIISAHRLTSPVLAGISGSGNLSGNANEIINASCLYNISVIKDYQADILRVVNKFQNINNKSEIEIIPLDVQKELTKSETEGEKVAEQGYDKEDSRDNEQIEQ